jgi:hypothetical protein
VKSGAPEANSIKGWTVEQKVSLALLCSTAESAYGSLQLPQQETVSVEVVVASQDLDHRSKICILKTYKVYGAIPLRLSPEHFALSGIVTHFPLLLPSIFNFGFDVSGELT